jgi:HPt (histidine-containing phosphotransfer) domain-containing protein
MSAQPIHDAAHFGEMTGDDPALQAEIVLLFRGQALLWRKLLSADAPVHTWRDAVHTLKGSARGLGLWRLASACETAEIVTRGCAPDAHEIAESLACVQLALDEALAALPEASPAPLKSRA